MTTSAMPLREIGPSPESPNCWAITTTSGYPASGYLPTWAQDDPSQDGVPLERLPIALADIRHQATFEGQTMQIWNPATDRDETQTEETAVLWGTIDCRPYAGEPQARMPVVNVAVVNDCWITDLDPDGVTDLAALLRAQADRLDHDIRPRLLAARTDWAEHQPSSSAVILVNGDDASAQKPARVAGAWFS